MYNDFNQAYDHVNTKNDTLKQILYHNKNCQADKYSKTVIGNLNKSSAFEQMKFTKQKRTNKFDMKNQMMRDYRDPVKRL